METWSRARASAPPSPASSRMQYIQYPVHIAIYCQCERFISDLFAVLSVRSVALRLY